jgi:hypothetical protein
MSASRHNYSTTNSAFTSALQDNASLHATLANLREDYLALETDYRECMTSYIIARDEAWKWHKLCVDENDYAHEQGLRAMRGGIVRRMLGGEKIGEIWRKKGECVWIRERSGERGCGRRLERFKEDFGRCKVEWQRDWAEWRARRREKSERNAEAARMWRENY